MSEEFWVRISKIAPNIGVKPKTLWAWKKRGYVPASNHYPLLEEAERLKVPLKHEELVH